MTYRLVWHKHPDIPHVWVADGVYEGQWYAIRRHYAKGWGAAFHDKGRPGQPVGGGTYAAVRRACAEHATRESMTGKVT